MRQFRFSEQAHKLDWTSPRYLNSHPLIVESIIQYHAFVDLCSQSFRELVPTLLIDLSWHTHMLSGERYRLDMLRLLDRFVDHTDKVEEDTLGVFLFSILSDIATDKGPVARAFEDTQQLWKARFRSEYPQSLAKASTTSALLQSQSTQFSERSTGFLKSSRRLFKSYKGTEHLPTMPITPEPATAAQAAQVLSTHNSMLVLSGNEAISEKRQARETALAKKGAKATVRMAKERSSTSGSRFAMLWGERGHASRGGRIDSIGRSGHSRMAMHVVGEEGDEGADKGIENIEHVNAAHDSSTRTSSPHHNRLDNPGDTSDLSSNPEAESTTSSSEPSPSPESDPSASQSDHRRESARKSTVPTPETDPDRLFLHLIPAEGVEVANFKSLGASGWDLWGPRDCTVLDGSQNRGDCCTGATISCSTNTRFSISTQDWSIHHGSLVVNTSHPQQAQAPTA